MHFITVLKKLHKRFFLSVKYPTKIFDIIIYYIILRNVFNY